MVLDGKVAATNYKQELKDKISKLSKKLTLLIVQINPDDGSKSYLLGRQKLGEELGVNVVVKQFIDPTNEEIIKYLSEVNNDKNINGVIIDRPFPKNLNEELIYSHLDINKDIDGCNKRSSFVPSTALASIMLIDYYNIDLKGKNAVILGRSKTVGRPLVDLLLNKDATVTVCHSKTVNLSKITKKADILFVAINKAEFIDKKYFNKKQIVVDIGVHYNKDGKLVGDCKKEDLIKLKTYSKVPGGVGVLTNIALFTNLYNAFKGE